MRSEAGNNSTEDSNEEEVDEECIDFKVVITADDWPAETSWSIVQVLDDGSTTEDLLAEGTNDPLISGEAVEYHECLPKTCMQFTIRDTGGDGLCCSHGEGSYEVYYDGEKVKGGGAFYDDEITVFGRCGETPAPSVGATTTEVPRPAPLGNSGNGGNTGGDSSTGGGSSNNIVASGGGSRYRCVQESLVDRGYVIDVALCSRFTDCYNEFIDMGDDWFCADGEVCTESPSCGDGDEKAETLVDETNESEQDELEEEGNESEIEHVEFEESTTESNPVGRPPTPSEPAKPTPVGRPMRPNPSASTLTVLDPTPAAIETMAPIGSTPAPFASTPPPTESTQEPTVEATSMEPSLTPTTSRPTQGPCDGQPCNRQDYCRSEHGFCGPDEGYCNEKSIWTKECKQEPTPAPSLGATTQVPTDQPITPSPALAEIFGNGNNGKPSFTKPSGGGKPGGGKGPNKNPQPKPTPTPSSPAPTETVQQSDLPTVNKATLSPTGGGTGSNFMMIGSQEEDESQGLSLGTVNFVSLPSDSEVPIHFITTAPTPSSATSEEMQENSTELETNSKDSSVHTTSAVLDSTANEAVNELECTGEPCDQDAWCRSAYGSCGPGFIYCNAKAIWTSSCRLTHPDATYSKETPKEHITSSQVSGGGVVDVESSIESVPAPSPSLGLPELPKPTLPTITDATEFQNQAAFAAHFATTDSSRGQDETHDDDDDDHSNRPAVTKPKDKEGKDSSESYSYPTMYDSPEYAKQWSEWAKQVKSSAPPRSYISRAIYFAALSVTGMLFCS